MHELSIAYGVLQQVESLAKEHRAKKIQEVELEIGVLAQVFPESLEAAFEMASEGGIAQGARLKMLFKNAQVHCLQCDARFESDGTNFACPSCRQARTEVVGGNDILLTAITFEDGDNE
jgi:hydrogenase nickel incorporation protein HypA/HybF